MANLSRSSTREDELSLLVKSQQPDIAIISEAELGIHDTVVIPGYISFFAPPAPSGKCRLFMLVKESLGKSTVVVASSHTDLWLRLSFSNPLTVVGVYRQWSKTEQADLESFYNRCANLLDGSRTIIPGDMNLDFNRKSDPTYSRFSMANEHFMMMEAHGLRYVGPHTCTYRSHGKFLSANGKYSHRESVLDHVYMLGDGNVNVSVIPLGVTDHMPVKTIIEVSACTSTTPGRKWISRRPLAKLSSTTLCQALEESFQDLNVDLYSCNDVDMVRDTIVAAIIKALDKVAPHRLVPADKPGHPSLFLAPDTLQVMRMRDAAACGHLPQYRFLRNKVCRLVRRDRLRGSLNCINRSTHNPSKLWSLARSFMGANASVNLPSSLTLNDGTKSSDEEELTSTLNSYFINKIQEIRSGINSPHLAISNHGASQCDRTQAFSFKYPSAGKVKAVISSLKNTGAVGIDNIPVRVLKLGASVLSGPIAHLVRLSFGSGKVPSAFKTAIVTPVYKGKGKSTTAASSFRPIAILTAMSKILERCAFESLRDFLEPRLPAGQYGFRPARSTTAAIGDAHGQWSSMRAAGHVLGIIGFDLTAAFDTLDSALLCSKLANIGIRGRPNNWFSDYLNDRKQCVQIGDTKSSFLQVKHGVPQGSVLGPLLFLAMVADMPQEIGLVNNPHRGYVAYADDLCAWSCGDSLDNVKADLTEIAKKVSNFASANYLALSGEKTQVMWSGLSHGMTGPDIEVTLTLKTLKMKPSQNIELLGVTFDKNLTSAPFLAAQHRAAAPILATLRRLTKYLPPNYLTKVASALLVGKLAYAAPVTLTPRLAQNEPTSVSAQKLQICINEAARIILRSRRTDKLRTERLLAKSGLPSLNHLVIKGIAVECWKAINKCTPLGAVICGGYKSTRPTRMTFSNKLPPAFKFPRNSMAWHSVGIWNLHEDLRVAATLNRAKSAAVRIAAQCPL